jgi:DNA-binding MarR family transcriptional regulator
VRSLPDDTLRPFGITTSQYTAMTVLEHRDDVTSAALAHRSFVTAQTMGDIVMTLERRGLIVRRPDALHARRLTIALTQEGRRLLDGVREDVRLIERRMAKGMSGAERDELGRLLRTVLCNLSEPAASERTR